MNYFTVFCISIQACCLFYVVRRVGAFLFFDADCKPIHTVVLGSSDDSLTNLKELAIQNCEQIEKNSEAIDKILNSAQAENVASELYKLGGEFRENFETLSAHVFSKCASHYDVDRVRESISENSARLGKLEEQEDVGGREAVKCIYRKMQGKLMLKLEEVE